MEQIFRKQQSEWSQQQMERVQQFFQCNSFLSKIYEHKHVQQLIKMTYIINISSEEPIYLLHNKRPAAVILLKGTIAVYKKYADVVRAKNQRRKINKGKVTQRSYSNSIEKNSLSKNKIDKQQYVKVEELHTYSDTIQLNCECKLITMHGQVSKCIFIPSFMHNKYMKQREQQKKQVTYDLLKNIFHLKQKKPILNLAESGCLIRQFKINNYIYREGDPTQSVFIILEGTAKLGQPSRLTTSTKNMRVLGINSIIGDKDLAQMYQQQNAICCSSHLRVLQIPKQPFLKFAKTYLPQVYKKISPKNTNKKKLQSIGKRNSFSISLRKSDDDFDANKLPTIFRYKSAVKNRQQDQKQYKLIKNSHILLDSSPPRLNKIRSKSSLDEIPKDIMYKRSKLFKKIRPDAHPVDLSHRIFQ